MSIYTQWSKAGVDGLWHCWTGTPEADEAAFCGETFPELIDGVYDGRVTVEQSCKKCLEVDGGVG